MTPDSNGNGCCGGARDFDRMSLMSGMPGGANTSTLTAGGGSGGGANTSSSAISGNSNLISWHGHSFQPMTFRIMNAICEVCRRSCSDLRSPPPALECVRCRMRIHRTHVENHEKFVVCPKTVRQWIIRAPSSADRKTWISRINQFKQESAFCNDVFASPAPVSARPSAVPPMSAGVSTVRYRSMRNFGGISLKDMASRRSIAVTFPRQSSSSSVVAGSVTPGTVLPSPPATTHTLPHHPTPSLDSQHDI